MFYFSVVHFTTVQWYSQQNISHWLLNMYLSDCSPFVCFIFTTKGNTIFCEIPFVTAVEMLNEILVAVHCCGICMLYNPGWWGGQKDGLHLSQALAYLE